MKKIICMFLTICLLLGTITGCDKQKKGGDGQTLTIGMPSSVTVEDYDTNSMTVFIEEALGINLEFIVYGSAGDAVNQLVLECAANEELPDVLWGFTALSIKQMNEFGEGGYFRDLTSLIEEHGDNFNAQMKTLTKEEQDRIWQKGTNQKDGCFYGMPLYSAVDIGDYLQNMMTINQTWLDAVGMSAPTTTEELYKVLKAFKTQDPNGNGKKDEIGMLSGAIWRYVMNAYVYYDQQNPLNVTDGKVWCPVITDEFREGIKFLNKLYKEDLLDELTFTASNEEIKTMISGDGTEAEVGIWSGHPTLTTDAYCEVLDQYTALAPLEGVTDKGGYGVRWPNDLYYCGFITKDCEEEKLEMAMKFLDFLYTDEAVTRGRFGEKGVNWEYSEEPGLSISGTESHIKVFAEKPSSEGNVAWGVVGPKIYTPTNYLAIATEGTDREGASNRIMKEHTSIMMEMKKPEETITGVIFNDEEQDRLNKIESSIKTYTAESISLFITGAANVNSNSEWQKYLDTLEEYHLSEQIAIYQKAYDRIK